MRPRPLLQVTTFRKKKNPENVETTAAANNNIQEADPETILTTTQWLSVISILLSMVGIYYKQKEIKALFIPPVEPKKEEGRIRNMD